MAFLNSKGRDLWDVNDDILRQFAIASLTLGISERRVQRRVGEVFNFYWACEYQLGLIQGLVADPQRSNQNTQPALSSDLRYRRRKDGSFAIKPRPIFGFTTLPAPKPRPTPSDGEIDNVLDQLLSKSENERAVCYWLCATWMNRAGLRRGGVAGLTVTSIELALRREGIVEINGQSLNLIKMGDQPNLCDELKVILSDMSRKGREHLFVGVIEKRNKHRFAPAPIDVIECTLDYIWEQRASLVASRSWTSNDSLFLSLKTGRGLTAAAIGNTIKTAFNEQGVAGSGHRLRAAFTTRRVRSAVRRARARHGRAFDIAGVLLEEAEALGHQRTSTLKPYIDTAVVEEALFDDRDEQHGKNFEI